MSTNTTTAPRPTIRITDLVGVTAARRQIQQVAQQPLTSSRSTAPIRRATPQAVSQTADTTPAQSPNFNLITSTGVVPATVTYPAQDFTPATPQAIRQIQISQQRQQFNQRIEPLRVGAVTPFGRFAERQAFALSARQETLSRRQQEDFSPVRQLDLIGTGLFQRGIQTAGAITEATSAPIPTAQRATAAVRRGVDSFRFTFQQRAQQDNTLSAIGGAGADVAVGLASPLQQAQTRPGTFAFDVGATAGVLAVGGVVSQSVRGRPTGRPVGDITVRLRETRTTTMEVPQIPQRTQPRISEPDIRLEFAESRGLFRTPARTTLDIRGDVVRRVQQTPDSTIVTAQRLGDPVAREITFKGTPGTRGRPATIREVDGLNIQIPRQTAPQIIQQPDPVLISTRGAAFRQERQAFTLLQPSARQPLTLRGQFVIGQRVTAAPATLQEFQTVVFSRRGRQAIVTDATAPTFQTPNIRFTRRMFENPDIIQTRTGDPIASIAPTSAGILSQIELRGQVLRSPPAQQVITERLRAVGIIRQVPLTERAGRLFSDVRFPRLNRRGQAQIIPQTPRLVPADRINVPVAPQPQLGRLRIPSPRVGRLRTTPRTVLPITQQTFTSDLRSLPFTGGQISPMTRISQPTALILPQQQRQAQFNIFQTTQIRQTDFFAQPQRFAGSSFAQFRPLPTPFIPISVPTPQLIPGGGGRGITQPTARLPGARRTRTILQQFLGGARGTRGREVTGLFLRN